jgi:serine protease Do
VQPLTPDLATAFGVKDGKGALVADVNAKSPAARAGLEAGDVVVRFDSEEIDDAGDLARAVGFAKPGQRSGLTVWRDRQRHTIEVTLGEAPAERELGAADERSAAALGLEVGPVTPEVARELDLKDATGVVVTAVQSGGLAADAGLQRGDVIVEIDRTPVTSIADFEKLTSQAGGERVLFRIHRDGGTLYVAMAPATK